MILVTGATGVVGQFAVDELLRRNYSVRVLVRSKSRVRMSFSDVDVAVGDLSDLNSLQRCMQGVTGVVHAACTFTDSAIDIAAMQTLLDHWHHGPFVFISSLDVYGITSSNPVTEEHPLSRTYNDYATGKVVCEELLGAKRGGFSILRAPYIWGPHPKARERLIHERLRDGKDIILPGSSEAEWKQYRDVWIDTRDLAWIIAECLRRPSLNALNVFSGHFLWHDLYVALIRLTGGKSRVLHKPYEQIQDDELHKKIRYAQTWQFSDAKLKKHLPFTPRYSFDETIKASVEV